MKDHVAPRARSARAGPATRSRSTRSGAGRPQRGAAGTVLSWAGDPGAAAGPLPGAGAAPAPRARARRGLGRHRRPLLRPHRARPRRGGCWYDVLDRRRSPAFAQLDDARSAPPSPWPSGSTPRATRCCALDAQSLTWRGKPAKAPGDRAGRRPPRAGRRLRRVPVDRAGRGLPPDGPGRGGSRRTKGPPAADQPGVGAAVRRPGHHHLLAARARRPGSVPRPRAGRRVVPGRRAGATWLGAVPLHRVLDRGWDAGAHRRLLRVDSVRVAAPPPGWPPPAGWSWAERRTARLPWGAGGGAGRGCVDLSAQRCGPMPWALRAWMIREDSSNRSPRWRRG